MKDIATKEDIQFLIEDFYGTAIKDEQLAPFFQHVDFEKHLPKMNQFWAFILIDEPGYTTNLTEKHAHMKLNMDLFNRWVSLFHAAVDRNFSGEKANLAKERTSLMGWTMGSKFT